MWLTPWMSMLLLSVHIPHPKSHSFQLYLHCYCTLILCICYWTCQILYSERHSSYQTGWMPRFSVYGLRLQSSWLHSKCMRPHLFSCHWLAGLWFCQPTLLKVEESFQWMYLFGISRTDICLVSMNINACWVFNHTSLSKSYIACLRASLVFFISQNWGNLLVWSAVKFSVTNTEAVVKESL